MKRKVRAAAAYADGGLFHVVVWNRPEGYTPERHDAEMAEVAFRELSDFHGAPSLGHHFVEAEIEIPDPVPVATVEGKVTE